MKILKTGFLIILVGFIAIQFIRPPKNSVTPVSGKDISQAMNVPSSVHTSLKEACYDCHSNNTKYTWYYNIQPVGLMMNKHITEGREELNFSSFELNSDKMKEIAEVVEENEMPLKSYLLVHKNARLGDDRKKELIDWAKSNQQTRQ